MVTGFGYGIYIDDVQWTSHAFEKMVGLASENHVFDRDVISLDQYIADNSDYFSGWNKNDVAREYIEDSGYTIESWLAEIINTIEKPDHNFYGDFGILYSPVFMPADEKERASMPTMEYVEEIYQKYLSGLQLAENAVEINLLPITDD